MRLAHGITGLALATALLGGCGGSGPGANSPAPTGQSAADELPMLVGDFDRVCETQVGFAGADAYDTASGLHPVVLFVESGDPPSLSDSSRLLPAGWSVKNDAAYANNSELAAVQLVACSRRVETKANGTCTFEGKDGAPDTILEKTDTTYELTVYAATTGERVGEAQTLKAAPSECPMFAFIREGETKWFNNPTDDQYVNALKAVVAS